jgi:hypothetical protein
MFTLEVYIFEEDWVQLSRGTSIITLHLAKQLNETEINYTSYQCLIHTLCHSIVHNWQILRNHTNHEWFLGRVHSTIWLSPRLTSSVYHKIKN